MSFNAENRRCIPGVNGCPACVAPLRHTGHQENFAQPPDGLIATQPQEEALGLCLVSGFAEEIGLNEPCRVSNEVYNQFISHTSKATLKSSLEQLPSNYHG